MAIQVELRELRSEVMGIDGEIPVLGGSCREYVNLDNAATTPVVRPVLDALKRISPLTIAIGMCKMKLLGCSPLWGGGPISIGTSTSNSISRAKATPRMGDICPRTVNQCTIASDPVVG